MILSPSIIPRYVSCRISCFALDAFSSITGLSSKSMREVWLDNTSQFYEAFGKEQILIDELPGYKEKVCQVGRSVGPTGRAV